MAIFREPDISPNESSDDEEMEDMQRSGFEDDTLMSDVAPIAQSPARWSKEFGSLSIKDALADLSERLTLANYLPHEILINVLRHVSTTRDLLAALLVSRSWCQCTVELLWQKPQFTRVSALFKMIQALGKRDPVFQYATFIRRLNLTLLGVDLGDQYLLRAAGCTRLERLTLFGCSTVSNDALESVLRCLPHLVALDITGVSEANDSAIIAAATIAPRLQGVNLGGCKKITDLGIIALATRCTNLRRIKLSGLEQITDAPIIALATNCPMLLELDLHNCFLVTDRAIREIWTHSTYLREFKLSNLSNLTERAFPANPNPRVGAQGANLQTANGQWTQHHVPVPPGSQPEDSMEPLILGRQFDHLRMLDLTGCMLVTDEAIEGIVVNCPKIRNLVLAKCGSLTDEAIGSITKLGRYLHYLHLGHVSNITDRAVTRLARACSRLRYIDLACCPQLSDMSVFELAHLPKLRRIGLVRVPNLTDQAIYSLADQQASLERIHLSYCENISIQAINYLLQRLLKLTHLSLTGIPAFRRPELQKFCRPPPQEFTPNQRAAFCVYSGHGVVELRRYLYSLIQSLSVPNPGRAPPVQQVVDEDELEELVGENGGILDLRDDPAHHLASTTNGNHSPAPNGSSMTQRVAQAVGLGSSRLGHTYGSTYVTLPSTTSLIQQAPYPTTNVVGPSSAPNPTPLNDPALQNGNHPPTLPFPITARTSVSSTPEPNGNGHASSFGVSRELTGSGRRRSPNSLLSFASALRGAWNGASRSPERTSRNGRGSSPNGMSNGNAVAGPSMSQRPGLPVITAPAPLSAHNVGGGGSNAAGRLWAHQVPIWTNSTASPAPSPTSSAAAFVAPSPSPPVSTSSRTPISRPLPLEANGTGASASRRDLRELEESLQSALSGAPPSSSPRFHRTRRTELERTDGSSYSGIGGGYTPSAKPPY